MGLLLDEGDGHARSGQDSTASGRIDTVPPVEREPPGGASEQSQMAEGPLMGGEGPPAWG